MSFADSNRTGLSWILETTWDTTPSGLFDYTRFTGETLNFNINNETSNEIRNDSNITDLIQVGAESSGGFTFEISYENPADDLLEGSLRSAAFGADLSAAVSAVATIAVETTDSYIASTGTPFATIAVGDWIRVKGFTDPANNGYKLVVAKNTSLDIEVAQTLVNEVEGDSITMYGTTIRNGTTDKSFSIMREHNDVSEFFKWSGEVISSLTLDVAANQIATGSIDFMGGTATSSATTYSKTLGTVTLDTGAAGSVDTLTVNSVAAISGAVSFDTSLTVTAAAVAANINAHTSSPNYTATSSGAVITIASVTTGTGSDGYVVASTATTMTTTDVNMAGGAPTAAPTNDVFSTVSDVATIYFDTTESTLSFMNISFTINNNLRGKPAIGTLGNVQIGKGVCDVTGSFSTYFENDDLYQKFINGTEFALYFGLHSDTDTPTSSNSYIFSFPRCKIETDSGPQAGGQNQDLIEEISFRAIYDSSSASTMSISKIVAG